MFFKLEQKATKKKENTWKINKKNFKTEKTGSKINGKKKERQKGWKIGNKLTCPFAFLLLFFGAFSICFFCCFSFAFFFAFAWKKGKKKSKTKANKKQKKQQKCKWTSPCFSHFFPFLSFLFVSFFSLLFCFCVFLILLICFLVFHFFLHFSRFFSSFKNKNKPWFGEHNTTVVN